jgi:adenylyl- and sulfurtransferase ThiI
MTVKARLGGAVASALPAVDVEVQRKAAHISVELDESGGVIVHEIVEGDVVGREGKREVCRWG